MIKSDFIKLYELFLKKVVNNVLVSDKVKNELYSLYYYLDEQDFKLIFNEFYKQFYLKLLPPKIEPSPEEWGKVAFSLFLDKASKKGYIRKVIDPIERAEVGEMAREMSEWLSVDNDK